MKTKRKVQLPETVSRFRTQNPSGFFSSLSETFSPYFHLFSVMFQWNRPKEKPIPKRRSIETFLSSSKIEGEVFDELSVRVSFNLYFVIYFSARKFESTIFPAARELVESRHSLGEACERLGQI